MWHLSSLTRDWTHVLCVARWVLNYWIPVEVPMCKFLCGDLFSVLSTSGNAGSYGNSVYSFEELPTCFPKVSKNTIFFFTIPPAVYGDPSVSANMEVLVFIPKSKFYHLFILWLQVWKSFTKITSAKYRHEKKSTVDHGDSNGIRKKFKLFIWAFKCTSPAKSRRAKGDLVA